MKILAFSDFHGLFGFVNYYIEVKKKINQYKPDLVLLCGDLQDRGSIKLLENRIQSVEFDSIYFIWGNSEEQLDINLELKNADNIHLKLRTFKGIHFIGLGGDEYDMKRYLPEIRKIFTKSRSKIEHLIIVSHVPPFRTVDLCNDGRNVGVPEFRDLITEFQPKLVVCGHIHEQGQKIAYIGSSMICNIGPKGVLFTIKDNEISTLMLD